VLSPRDVVSRARGKHLDRWLGGWLRDVGRRAWSRAPRGGPRHLLFAFCDHFEPLWGGATREVGSARVRAWREGYGALAEGFRDADGLSPRHSFFYPGEQYEPAWLEALAGLTREGHGEVELHLHHDNDTEVNLRRDLASYIDLFAGHGHLARDRGGRPRYAFIHGNWCLSNARPDGRYCGVDQELPLLHETGCYADFTFPSAPDVCQPGVVNRIFWPVGDLARRRAYERTEHARVGATYEDRILMMTGPLALSRRPRSLEVRIESSAVTARDPATRDRVRTWAAQSIHVAGRPEWVFVKVHTHGAPEAQARSLLGEPGRAMHAALRDELNDGERWRLHYVTAREMYNVAIAATRGHAGDPNDYRDHVLPPPPASRHGSLR
jgi:hypothetical protein